MHDNVNKQLSLFISLIAVTILIGIAILLAFYLRSSPGESSNAITPAITNLRPTTQQITSTISDSETRHPSPLPTITSESDCLNRGGEWFPDGLAQIPACYFPAADAGEPCTDSDQCEGECRDYVCSDYLNNPFGCYSIIENNQPREAICVD